MIDIVLVRSNSIIYNPRVWKIATSLSKRYSILLLGWNRESLSKKVIENYFVNLTLLNLKAPFRKKSLIAYFPFFWIWIFIELIVSRPKIVHACDLDTVIPCYLYKLIFRKKLIFDVHDRISMSRISPKNKIVYSLVNFIEEFYCKHSDVFTTVTEKVLTSFKRKPRNYAIILNCAVDQNFERKRQQNGILRLSLVAGTVERRQGLERITTAMKDLTGIELVFAGRVLDKEFLEQILKKPNVKFKGLLLPKEAIELVANSDVVISLYDLSIPNFKVALPIKTFEAMMLGLPVITNIAHELINEVRCGIEVEWDNIETIKSALIRLRDDTEFRRKLGKNGRIAFEQKYNWNNMEKKLYQIYDNLLKM